MYLTFQEYTSFGYSVIPEDKFERYVYKAGNMAETQTLGRVNDDFLQTVRYKKLADKNKRGICEIADILYKKENPVVGEAGAPITGFKNEGYSETFAQSAQGDFDSSLSNILSTFFTQEQLCRRGC